MELMYKNKVAIYCSQFSKYGLSIEEQKEKLKKYCKHFDIEIVKEYIDYDINNKVEYQKMFNEIKNRKFNIILTYDINTLLMNNNGLNEFELMEDFFALTEEMNNYKCELHFESSYIYTPIIKPLFRIDISNDNSNIEEPPKKKSKVRPIFEEYDEIIDMKKKGVINWATFKMYNFSIDFDFVEYGEDYEPRLHTVIRKPVNPKWVKKKQKPKELQHPKLKPLFDIPISQTESPMENKKPKVILKRRKVIYGEEK